MRRRRRLDRRELSGLFARLFLGLSSAALLSQAIVGDRHHHVAAWIVVSGLLFGTAAWSLERLQTSRIPLRRWWFAAAAVFLTLPILPPPLDLVEAAIVLATLALLANRSARRPGASRATAAPRVD